MTRGAAGGSAAAGAHAGRKASAALAAALLPAIGGCVLHPVVSDPAVDIPRSYRHARGDVRAALPRLDWWRGFRSPELSKLMEEAQVANLDIAVAIARIVQADAQARVAGAPLLPLITFEGEVARSRPPGGPDRATLTVALNASYEIDFWGKNRATLRAAEQNAVASRFDREVVALSTLASVANTYFQLLAAQDRLRYARENLRSATRVLDAINQRLAAGTATALDVAQQESVVANVRASIPPLEQTIQQNKAILAVLIGRPPELMAIRGGSLDRIALPRVTPGLPSELLTQRPDIREAEAQLAAADANVYAARAALLPTIALTGQGGYQSSALKTLFTPQSAFYSAAVSLVQPIFDGYRLRGLLDLEKGRQEELLQIYRRTVISAFADVENALVAIAQSAERDRLQRQALASARRAFELSEQRLREGTIDVITLLNTQQTLFQAQDAVAQARLARLQALLSLFQALGGGWPMGKEGWPLGETASVNEGARQGRDPL
jgi:NodT family efflux transporter outer membrane factor (OMF) lipoprotein